MNIIVEISNKSDKWKSYLAINEQFFIKSVRETLIEQLNFQNIIEVELSILLTEDTQMQELNKEFRGKDKATNVLSFPDFEDEDSTPIEFIANKDYIYLGDIAFGFEVIKFEAEQENISFLDHMRHLTIHAILHLIGYDHKTEHEAEIMESIEITILQQFNIKSPY